MECIVLLLGVDCVNVVISLSFFTVLCLCSNIFVGVVVAGKNGRDAVNQC